MKLIFCLFLSVYLTSLKADFVSGAKSFHPDYNGFIYPFMDGHLYSVWGRCNRQEMDLAKLNEFKTKFLTSSLVPFKLTTLQFINSKPPYLNHLRELVVIIPGAFTNLTDFESKRLSVLLANQGKDVLTLPNPWSIDAINDLIPHHPGHVEQEINAYFDLTREFLENYNLKFPKSKIHLLGLSYGALISLAIFTKDANSNRPLINGKVTLLSPPKHLKDSLEYFDYIIKKDLPLYDPLGLTEIFSLFKTICNLRPSIPVAPYLHDMARIFSVFGGFQWELAHSSATFDKVWKINQLPSPYLANLDYLRWRKKLTFRGHLSNYAPTALREIYSDYASFDYWEDQLTISQKVQLQIITAQNDFINPTSFEGNNPYTWNLISGGHLGYRFDKWYEDLLQLMYY